MVFKRYFRSLLNTGVYGTKSVINRRRIRILNIFNFICATIIITYFSVNMVAGTVGQGFTILTGLFLLTIPVYVLNLKTKIDTAKLYFVLVAILFLNFMAYKTLFQFQYRDNDFIMIGFSTLIIVLFDNPLKFVLFLFNASLAISLKIVRIIHYQPETTLSDNWFSIMNLLTAFVCVYFFTDIYKGDVVRSETRIRAFAKRVKRQNFLVQTERDELVYNKQLLRTTIDNIPVFITMLDAKGRFIIVNSRFEKALKLKIEELEGVTYGEVLGRRVAQLTKPLFERCLRGNEVEINHPIFFPSGEMIHAFGKYIPLINNEGEVTQVLSFVTDIKRIKNTERKLRDINTSKDKILSILSHDLRGPLNSLSGLLDYSKEIDPPVFDQLMGNIKRQVSALNFTLDNVLSWVRTQLGGFVAHQQKVELSDVVDHNLELYREQLKEKSITVDNGIMSKFFIKIDPDHLDIVVRNLMSNAIKFTPESGKISFQACSLQSAIEFSIKDSGVGMNQPTISKITKGIDKNKPYTSPGTNGEKGTGLGLNFCIDILALNEATMKIISEPNAGTQIKLCIPKA